MRIGVVAGEASGDLLGESLIQAIHSRYPEARFEGIAGPRMQACGAESLFPIEALSVRGYLEVLRSLPRLIGIRRRLADHFLADPPDFFIGIDAPDFNLGLEERLKRSGIPTAQMVAPTVWAWRPERVVQVARSVDELLCIFPFEAPLFESHGISVSYIGHPLAKTLAPPSKDRLEKAADAAPLIALLPGSRLSEIEFHGKLFFEVASRLWERYPLARFRVPLVTSATRNLFERLLADFKGRPLPIEIVSSHAQPVLAEADLALVASGTATLEAALLGCPMVVTYRLSAVTAWLFRRKSVARWVSLPNIILGREVVQEFLQERATPDALAQALIDLYENADGRRRMMADYETLHQCLLADTPEQILKGVEKLRKARRAT